MLRDFLRKSMIFCSVENVIERDVKEICEADKYVKIRLGGVELIAGIVDSRHTQHIRDLLLRPPVFLAQLSEFFSNLLFHT